jgi:REP element-mobilizing transposase RayT
MPQGLKRYYGVGHLHFVTCSCYQRWAWLGTARRRDLFLRLLEQTREAYGFVVLGYVVMPEHFHLLISEPQRETNGGGILQIPWQRYRKLRNICGNPARFTPTPRGHRRHARSRFSAEAKSSIELIIPAGLNRGGTGLVEP